MKKTILALGVLACGITISSAIPLYEPFNYTAGVNLIGQSNADLVVWFQAGPNSALTNQPIILAGNLSYGGLPASSGASMKMGGSGGMGARFQFGALTTGTVYYSFLCRINDITGLNATGVFWAGLNNSAGSQTTTPTTAGARILTRSSGAGFQLGLDKGSGTAGDFVFDPTVFNVGDVILIVARYTINPAAGDDETRLWLNPTPDSFGAAEPSTSSLTNATGADQSQLASLIFLNRAADQPLDITIDELRVGTTWAEVTASTANPNTLVKFDPSGLGGQPTQFLPSVVHPNVVVVPITRGSGLTIPAGTSAAFNNSAWSGTNAATSLSSNDYCTFSITVAANHTLAFTELRSVVSRSGTGPDNAAWVYSQDAFSALLATASAVSTANGAPSTLSGTLTDSGITVPVEFRLLAWSNNVVAGSGGTLRIGNAFPVVLNGSSTLRSAGTLTWDGGGSSDDWDAYNGLAANQSNWDLNKTPTTALVDSLVFDGNTRLHPNNNIVGLIVDQVTFNATAGAFTLQGNGFTLNNGIVQNSPEEERISTPLALGGSQSWQAAAGALLVGAVDLSAATLTISGTHVVDVAGTVSGTGGITKTGAGQLWLHAANTYSGGTIVSGGVLVVNNGSGSGTGSGAVSVAADAVLRGNGSIAGNVSIEGAIGAGFISSLTISGSLSVASSGALFRHLNSSTASADEIIANGVILASGAQLALGDLDSATLALGTAFTIVRNTSADPVSGTFADLPEAATFAVDLNTYRISYVAGTGNDIVLTVVDIAPPIITCPTNITVQCDSDVPAPNFAGGTVSDNFDPSPAVTHVSDNSAGSCPRTITRTYKATDASGNMATCAQTIVVHDTMPPVITCPGNITVNIPSEQSSAVVNYPPPTVSDNCSGVTSNCTPASGTSFPLGTNTVTCTATDGCTNQSMCAFTVTVAHAQAIFAANDSMGALANHAASISEAKLMANDSNPGGGSLSVSAVSASSAQGGTVSLTSGVLTYTPATDFTGGDQFSYTITNSAGASASGTVFVTVRSDKDASPNLISSTPTQNGVLVRFAGIPGRGYGIERSVDSMTWTAIGSATAQSNGLVEFEDTTPPPGVVYYRAVAP